MNLATCFLSLLTFLALSPQDSYNLFNLVFHFVWLKLIPSRRLKVFPNSGILQNGLTQLRWGQFLENKLKQLKSVFLCFIFCTFTPPHIDWPPLPASTRWALAAPTPLKMTY